MSQIEANIVIDAPYDLDLQSVIRQIEVILTQANGAETHINVIEMDNPITGSPINISKAMG